MRSCPHNSMLQDIANEGRLVYECTTAPSLRLAATPSSYLNIATYYPLDAISYTRGQNIAALAHFKVQLGD